MPADDCLTYPCCLPSAAWSACCGESRGRWPPPSAACFSMPSPPAGWAAATSSATVVLTQSCVTRFLSGLFLLQARKSIPIDRLEQLRSQLSSSTHPDLCAQLEEVIARLEPMDSASSSRRSSISSHVRLESVCMSASLPDDDDGVSGLPQESFNVLDCGIYRVISRRGSQSDEETGSLINPSTSEEERLKDFSFVQEEEQADQGRTSLSV